MISLPKLIAIEAKALLVRLLRVLQKVASIEMRIFHGQYVRLQWLRDTFRHVTNSASDGDIEAGRQVVNIQSFMVRVDSRKHIDFSVTSSFRGGRPGRVKRKNQRATFMKAAGGDGDEKEDEQT
ncbi:40S ribosomal protein S9-like [Durio zibethinus]|uniref:40S ribosomal protein S9-like n=1 Tax=Durio zibethinus TaxID=66656 RepID=A0A6P5X345_DURZI|nr:40S ribosomal protein S9-like [Durio zibethinus]